MSIKILQGTAENISLAAQMLRDGGLVALPTETVYGLGADATSDTAVASIFEAKGRPTFNPLIIHVPDVQAARGLVEFNDMAELLASQYWPGALTLILPRRADCPVSLLASAGLPTLAVRVPAHPLAKDLLKALGRPVAAPSANRSGQLSPTTPAHVVQSLGDVDGYVLAGGKCTVGLESTVVDVTGDVPVVLRPGAITPEDIKMLCGDVVVELSPNENNPKSPGQLLKHYAPKTPLRLKAVDVAPDEALLGFGSLKFMGVRGGGWARDLPAGRVLNLSETGDLNEAAANLFAMLHQLDTTAATGIAVMSIPDEGLGLAINDRLKRAAEG